MTTRRSRSSGFPAPPTSLAFRLDLGVFRCVANLAITSGIGIPPMTLQSPSRFSSAFLPLAPDRQTVPFLRSGHPPVGFGAPSALPTRGIHFPVRRVPPVPPAALTVGRSRSSQLGSRSAGPPYLVAGFHSRCGPPASFLTTLAACSSSGPVECFIHSRPWGSCPCSPMLGSRSADPKVFLPGASFTRCVPRCVSHETRGTRFHSGGSWSTPRWTAAEASIQAARPPLPSPKR